MPNIAETEDEYGRLKVPMGAGLTIEVVYYVGKYTSEFLFRHRGHATYVMLAELIRSWDLKIYKAHLLWQEAEIERRRDPARMGSAPLPKISYERMDPEGREEVPFPLEEAHMSFLPMRVINAISEAIARDQSPNPTSSEDTESSF